MSEGNFKVTSEHFTVGHHPEINMEIIERPADNGDNAKYRVACGCGWVGLLSKNRIKTKWYKGITWCRQCSPNKRSRTRTCGLPDVVRANAIMAEVNAVFKPSVLLKDTPYYW